MLLGANRCAMAAGSCRVEPGARASGCCMVASREGRRAAAVRWWPGGLKRCTMSLGSGLGEQGASARPEARWSWCDVQSGAGASWAGRRAGRAKQPLPDAMRKAMAGEAWWRQVASRVKGRAQEKRSREGRAGAQAKQQAGARRGVLSSDAGCESEVEAGPVLAGLWSGFSWSEGRLFLARTFSRNSV
jgi:hypothetical protein